MLKRIVTIPVNRNQIRFPVGALSSASNLIANVPYELVSLSSIEDYVPGFFLRSGGAGSARRGHVFIFWSVSMENSP